MVKAIIHFQNDESVGIRPEYFEMETPFYDKFQLFDYGIEDARGVIKRMYDDLHEFGCTVYFDFEDLD